MSPLPARTQEDFSDEILVICPACGGKALSRMQPELKKRYLVCLSCCLNKPEPSELKLWLEADTRLGTLYAFNIAHLDYIETYVRSGLRKVEFEPDGIRNAAITSRLPLWIKQAKNRAEVLKAIERLRRK